MNGGTLGKHASLGDIADQAGAVLREQWKFYLLVLLGTTAAFSALDVVAVGAANLVSAVLGVFLGYEANDRALKDWHGGRSERRRYGAYFGVSFLSGLGVLLGFVLLVVPGIYLTARWSAASALIVAEDNSVFQAMRNSWDMTSGSVWPISAVVLIYVLIFAIIFGAFGLTVGMLGAAEESLGFIVSLNFGGALANVIGWILFPAIYRALRNPSGNLDSVFA